MEYELNHLQQPVGLPVHAWQAPLFPVHQDMEGRFCRLEPLNAEKHAQQLFDGFAQDTEGKCWTYLFAGPFANFREFSDWIGSAVSSKDPQFYAIVDTATHQATGMASYLRIDPKNGCIEVGHLNFSPLMQRTPIATEAMYLMMKRAFEAGYRRYEWKCNALNEPSRKAAQRLGFSYEGLFRQAIVVKGRNRDTAWYSIIDSEWPELKQAFEQWLKADNFDAEGRQRVSLSSMTKTLLKQKG